MVTECVQSIATMMPKLHGSKTHLARDSPSSRFYILYLGTCESEISVRIELNRRLRFEFESNLIESGVVVYMFNADCHVYVIMCKPTALLHATLYVMFFVCTVGLHAYNLLITYDDDDDDDETEKPTSPTLKTCEWEQY